MLAGVSYETAEAAFNFPKGTRTRRTTTAACAAALVALGKQPGPMTPSAGVPPTNALLKCNRGEKRVAGVKGWHWVVWCAETMRALDPLDDGKVRPMLAYMPVTNP